MLSKKIRSYIEERKKTPGYWATRLKLDFALQLDKRLRVTNTNYAELANRIGVSPPYISKVLHGESNLTIDSMVKLAHATGSRIDLRFIDEGAVTEPKIWFGKFHSLAAAKPSVTVSAPSTVSEPVPYKQAA